MSFKDVNDSINKIMGSMMSSVSKFVYCVEALRKKQAGEE